MTRFPDAGFTRIEGTSRFRIEANSSCFDGHFDGAPILPGVAHLAIALEAFPGVLTGVRDVRFSRPLGPGDEVEVVLTPASEPSSMRFEIRCEGKTASAGVLVFAS